METGLEQGGCSANAKGINEYLNYDFYDIVGDVGTGIVEGKYEELVLKSLPLEVTTLSTSKERCEGL